MSDDEAKSDDNITFEETYEMLGLNEEKLNELVSSGQLRGFRSGSSMMFSLVDVVGAKNGIRDFAAAQSFMDDDEEEEDDDEYSNDNDYDLDADEEGVTECGDSHDQPLAATPGSFPESGVTFDSTVDEQDLERSSQNRHTTMFMRLGDDILLGFEEAPTGEVLITLQGELVRKDSQSNLFAPVAEPTPQENDLFLTLYQASLFLDIQEEVVKDEVSKGDLAYDDANRGYRLGGLVDYKQTGKTAVEFANEMTQGTNNGQEEADPPIVPTSTSDEEGGGHVRWVEAGRESPNQEAPAGDPAPASGEDQNEGGQKTQWTPKASTDSKSKPSRSRLGPPAKAGLILCSLALLGLGIARQKNLWPIAGTPLAKSLEVDKPNEATKTDKDGVIKPDNNGVTKTAPKANAPQIKLERWDYLEVREKDYWGVVLILYCSSKGDAFSFKKAKVKITRSDFTENAPSKAPMFDIDHGGIVVETKKGKRPVITFPLRIYDKQLLEEYQGRPNKVWPMLKKHRPRR